MFLNNTNSINNEFFLVTYNPALNIKNKFFNFFLLTFIFNFFNNIKNFNIFIKNSFQKKIKKINNYKSLFRLKKRSLSVKFLFNKLFKMNIVKKSLNSFSTIQLHNTNTNNKNFNKILFKTWKHLIGNSLSPYSWELHYKKKTIVKNLNFFFLKNRYFFFSNKYYLNISSKKKYIRKFFYNNYFYLNKINLNYNKLNLLIKSKLKKNFRNRNDWFLSKPYSFLNTFRGFKFSTYFSNFVLIRLFKTYSRMFNFFKRFNYKLKKKQTINLYFKNFLTKKLIAQGKRNSKIYTPGTNIRNIFSFFLFKKNYNIYLKNRSLPYLFKKSNNAINSIKTHKKFNNIKLIKKLKKFKKFKKIYFISWLFSLKKKFKINRKNKLLPKLKSKFSLKKKITLLRKNNYLPWKFKKLHIIKTFYKTSLNRSLKPLKLENKVILKLNFKNNFILSKFLKNAIHVKRYQIFKKKFKRRFKKKFTRGRKNAFEIKLEKKIKKIFKPARFKSFKFSKKIKSIFKTNTLLNFTTKSFYLNNTMYRIYIINLNTKFVKNVKKHIPKPIIKNKYKMNFLNNNYGFLFLNNFQSHYLKLFTNFNTIKKFLFSFSYKNELQKFILKRYTKFNNYFSNFFNNTKNFKNLTLNFNIPSSTQSTSFINTFFNLKNNLSLLNETNYFYNKNWSRYNSEVLYWKNWQSEQSEINIKRIRFKPGYMKIWRQSRASLQSTLSLNFKYQHKMTKYLYKFHKFIKFKTFLINEMTLKNILIRSRIFTETSLIDFLIINNLIYVNGYLVNNNIQQLFVGDFIQLILNLKYYITFKWLLNFSLKKKNRLKKLSRKKSLSFASDKKKSNNLPKWVLFSKNSFDDVAKFLEVDYFTLSIFVIYEPFLWSDLNIYNIINNKFSIINIYNWKYIN